MDRNFLLFLVLAAIWGGSFVAIKEAIAALPFEHAVFWRIAFGAVFTCAVVLLKREKLAIPLNSIQVVWIIGIFAQLVPFTLLFWAEQYVSAGLAGIFNGTMPIFASLLSIIMLRDLERFSSQKFVGLILGLAGIIFICWPSLQLTGKPEEGLGALALLGMSFSYGFATVLSKRLLAKSQLPISTITFHFHLTGFFILGAFLLLTGQHPTERLTDTLSNPIGFLSVIYLGVLASGLAWLIYYLLIDQWGSVRAATVTYLVPVVALVLDFAIFGEIPRSLEVLGMTVVMAGLVTVQRAS